MKLKCFIVIVSWIFCFSFNFFFRTHGGTLEIDPTAAKEVDLMVTQDKSAVVGPYRNRTHQNVAERQNSEDFIDDPDVPPLM